MNRHAGRTIQADRWHRSHPDAKVAGVCTALAHALALPVTGVRLGFVLATLLLPVHILGPLAYAALFLLIPKDPGSESVLEQWLRRGLAMASRFSGRPNGPEGPPSVI